MMTLACDHCSKPFDDVVYVVQPKDARNGHLIGGEQHLHWDCLPLWGRS